MLGGDLQTPRGVVFEHRFEVGALVEEVVADTASDEGLLDPLYGANLLVECHEGAVVVVQIRTPLRVEARRAAALGAELLVAPCHAIHVGRRGSHIGEVAAKILHAGNLLYLAQDRTLAARLDKLPLVRRDGAEGAAAEAAAVDIHRVLDHLPRGDRAAILVAGVRGALVVQVERAIELLGREHRGGGIHHDPLLARLLDECCGGVEQVALGLDGDEVLAEGLLRGEALLVGVQTQRLFGVETLDVGTVAAEGHLRNLAQQLGVVAVAEGSRHLYNGAVAHAIDQQIGPRRGENRGVKSILPIVVVGQASQRGLDAAQHNGGVRKELLQDARIDRYGAVGAEARLTTGRVGVVVAQAEVGRVVVDHRIHRATRHGKEYARRAQLLEVAQVVAPIRLRYDRHAIPLGLQQTTDDGRPERGVVDVGVAREEHNVEFVPAAGANLFQCSRKEGHQEYCLGVLLFRLRIVSRPNSCRRPRVRTRSVPRGRR